MPLLVDRLAVVRLAAVPALPSVLRLLFGTVASMIGAAVVLAWRVRETRRPVTALAIVLPPCAMATGFAMFALPAMRIPLGWAAGAVLTGMLLLAVPLVRTTRLERRGDEVMVQRSRAFLAVLLVLFGVRLALREYLDRLVTPLQTAALFYLLAFGMIVAWRAWMFRQYRRLQREAATGPS